MIKTRQSEERGHANHGWLDSRHSFSFADYYDPQHIGFRSLRVINEDRVAGGAGFHTHPHRDMEIITYVLSGALQHRDSLGHSAVIKAGDVQRITAGTGIEHSEFNASSTEPVHFLQIWILPERRGLNPGYDQKSFGGELRSGQLQLVASKDGWDGAITINQDVDLFIGKLGAGDAITHTLKPKRHAWVQVAEGEVTVNGQLLQAGDGAAVSEETTLNLASAKPSQILLFDLS